MSEETKDLEIYLATDQPETCRNCGVRTSFEDISPDPENLNSRQKHTCPNCGKVYVLEFDPEE